MAFLKEFGYLNLKVITTIQSFQIQAEREA